MNEKAPPASIIGARARAASRWPLRRRLMPFLVGLAVITGANAATYGILRTRSVPSRLRRLGLEARRAVREGRLREAARSLEEAIALSPDEASLAVELASIEDRRGRHAAAEDALERAIARVRPPGALVAIAAELAKRGSAGRAFAFLAPVLGSFRALEGPRRAEALLVAGEAAAQAGALESAETLLREASAEKRSGRALRDLAEVLERRGSPGGAEDLTRSVLEAEPRDHRAALLLARILARTGRDAEARTVLETAMGTRGAIVLALAPALCALHLRSGRVADARALLPRLGPGKRANALAAVMRGAIAVAEGDPAGAVLEYRRAASMEAWAPHRLVLVARAALRAGTPEEARTALEGALALAPGGREAELDLLAALERLGDAAGAKTQALRLIERDDTRPAALHALLRAAIEEGSSEEMEALTRRWPADPDVLLCASLEIAARAGPRDASQGTPPPPATDVGVQGPGASPRADFAGAFAAFARGLEARGAEARAIAVLRSIGERVPAGMAPAHVALAKVYERIGRTDLAKAELSSAGLEPAVARAAIEALERRSAEEPVRALESALRADPDDAGALDALARIRLGQGDVAAARRAVERIAALCPGSPIAQARLAWMEALAGRREAALRAARSARRLDARLAPDDGEVDSTVAAAARSSGGPLADVLAASDDPRLTTALAGIVTGRTGAAAELLAWESAGQGARTPCARAMIEALGPPSPAEASERSLPAGLASPSGKGSASAESGAALSVVPSLSVARSLPPDPRGTAALVVASLGALELGTGLQKEAGLRRERVEVAARLAERSPRDPSAAVELGRALFESGCAERAASFLHEAESRFPGDPRVALALGRALERSRRPGEALEAYGRAAEEGHPCATAWTAIARVLEADLARRAAAIEAAQRSTELACDSPEGFELLGRLLFRDGRATEARAPLARAAQLEPDRPEIRVELARAIEAAERSAHASALAVDRLETALLMGKEVAGARAELEALRERIRGSGARAASPPRPRLLEDGRTLEGPLDESGAVLRLALGSLVRSLEIAAGPRGDLEVELLSRTPAGLERAERSVRVAAGTSLVLPDLAERIHGPLAARLSLAPPEKAPPAPDRGGLVDYRARLLPASPAALGDLEPNDRMEAAVELRAGEPVRGSIGPVDPVDWFSVRATGTPASVQASKAFDRVRGGCAGGATADAPKVEDAPQLASSAPEGAAALRADAQRGSAAQLSASRNDSDVLALQGASSENAGRERIQTPFVSIWLRDLDRTPVCARRREPQVPQWGLAPLALEIWEERAGGTLLVRRLVLAGSALVIPRWRLPRGRLLLGVSTDRFGETPRAERSYELSIEGAKEARAGSTTGARLASQVGAPETLEVEPNDRPDEASIARIGLPFRGTLEPAFDRDFVRVPPVAPGARLAVRLRSVSCSGEPAPAVVLRLFALEDLREVARFEAPQGALDLEALELPRGPAVLEITASGARGPLEAWPAALRGLEPERRVRYELTLGSVPGKR